jgi:hypothetical protein
LTPETPVTLTEAVTELPKVIGLGGLSVRTDRVGVALFTVKVLTVLVEVVASEDSG